MSILLAAALVYVSATALYHAVSSTVIRDEHQFLAGAYLIAEHGLQPYRDFAYFHMPNLSYLQSALFATGGQAFLGARLISAACAVGIVIALFLASRAVAPRKPDERWMIVSLSCAVLFANTKLFADAAGFVWNHAPSALTALLAFMLLRRSLRGGLSWWLCGASGLLLGLAIGLRLSAFPLILPFLAALLLAGGVGRRRRTLAVGAFALGGLLANLPGLYAAVSDPEAFFFGNLGYPRLNTLYRLEIGYATAMTLPGKVEFALRELFPRPAEILLLSATAFSLAGVRLKRAFQILSTAPDFMLLLSLVVFSAFGTLAPSPSFPQYYIGPAVFATLLAPYGLAYLKPAEIRRSGAWLLAAGALLSTLYGGLPKSSAGIDQLRRTENWVPTRVRAQSAALADQLADQRTPVRVLTLAPIFAIEAGSSIFPEFAAGPFAYRVSHLMSPAERQRFRVVSPAELQDFLQSAAPAAVLTGSPQDGELEGSIRQIARQLGFRPEPLPGELVLWIR